MYDICICCLLLVHAPLFLRDADILITCDWVMVISGLYICFWFSFCLKYFGVRRPDLWESRTVCIFCACLSTVSIYDVDGYFLTWSWLVWIILLFIRIVGGWDWPGVGIWRIYTY